MVQTMTEGFKHTEVGVIPSDWEVEALYSLTSRIGDGIHSTPKYDDVGEYYFVNGNNLSDGKVKISEETKRVSKEEAVKHFRILNDKTVLLSINGTIGNVALYKNEKIILGKSAAYLNVNEKIEKEYFYQSLQTEFIKTYFENELTGSTIKNLGLNSIRNTPIALPPTLAEQTAIATALNDADALIQKLEQLIAKKRNIKTGAMQELLRPKEGWEVKKLGEVAHIKTGSRNNEDKIPNGEYPFFVRSAIIEKIDVYSYDCEAILIPGDGNIGEIFHYIVGKFEVHQRVYKVSDFRNDVIGKYVHLWFQMNFKNHAYKYTAKNTVDSLRLPIFQEFEILFPKPAEQTRIAQILSDMDNEIQALEAQLEQYKRVKQGMMQSLLTGKIRLV